MTARVRRGDRQIEGQSLTESPTESALGRRVLVGTTSLVAAQVASIALALAAVKVITSSLGRADYGVYATAIAFTAIFSLLADFGVNTVTAREVARDPSHADRVVSLSIGLRVALSLVVAPIILLGSFVAYPQSHDLLHVGVAFIAATFLPDAVRTVLFGYLTATSRNHWVAVLTVTQQGAFLGFAVLAVASHVGLIGVFGAYLVSSAIATVIAVVLTSRFVSIRLRISWRSWQHLIQMSISIGAIQVVNLLYLRADSLLISLLLGPSATGVYAVAYMAINGVRVIPGFLMSSLLPKIVSSDDQARLAVLRRALDILALMAALLVALLGLAASSVVDILSSPAFDAAALPLLLLGLATFFSFINPVFGYTSAALNIHRNLVWISTSALALNVLLNLLLIPLYGLAGCATATLISEALAFVATYISFCRRARLRVPLAPMFARSVAIIGIALLLGRASDSVHAATPPIVDLAIATAEALLAAGFVEALVRCSRRLRHGILRVGLE